MTKNLALSALIALAAARAQAVTGYPFNPYGDARLAYEQYSEGAGTYMYEMKMPAGQHQAITVTGWMRLVTNENFFATTAANYTPEAIQWSNPDLLAGAGGFPSNTMLQGTITVAQFPWKPYTDPISSNVWRKGVYTVAGWSSNTVTMTVGGADFALGPGEIIRNVIPGPADSVVISGTGLVCVAISRTPDCQFFSNIDGVVDAGQKFTPESVITNEISFCAWRIMMTPSNQVYRSDLTRIDKCTTVGITQSHALPRTARAYDSRGIYQFGIMGLGLKGVAARMELFDFRAFPFWVSDEELCRIHQNGADEIRRRGIPRWKY